MGKLFDQQLAATDATVRSLVRAAMMNEARKVLEAESRHSYARNTAGNIVSSETERERFLDAFVWRALDDGVFLSAVVKDGTMTSNLGKVAAIDAELPRIVGAYWDMVSNVPKEWQPGWPEDWRPGHPIPGAEPGPEMSLRQAPAPNGGLLPGMQPVPAPSGGIDQAPTGTMQGSDGADRDRS